MKELLKGLGAAIVGRPQARQQGGSGAAAESLAEHHLRSHGLQVLARNVRYRNGELDLICRHGATLVFVEVRLRHNPRFGGAAASITPAKQRRVVHAARQWLAGEGRDYAHSPCRFDVVLLHRVDPDSLTWIRGAFDGEA